MKDLLFPKSRKGNRLPIFSKVGPSEAFVEFFCRGGGSIAVDCQLCGRTHYDESSSHNMNRGEFARLERKRKTSPDRYISASSTVWFCYVGDLQAVVGCPCNGLTIIEEFLWGDSHRIAEYLVGRAKVELKDAQLSVESGKKALKAAKK